ncbi:MAG TPA: glycosyltransferase [Thermoanaerobaculia bacterium]|nr:glycosyltransferase [Thermoanaerobaculia bacterium]
MSLPDESFLLNQTAAAKGADVEACFALARQYAGKFDYILGECTGAFLWHTIFRLAGDWTPFVIIPRYNHVYPPHVYPLLLSSQLRQPADTLFTGCGAASRAFSRFGFRAEPLYLPGLDLTKFKVLPESREDLRASLGLSVNCNVLLYTGRIADDKNVLELLEIFEAVKRSLPAELILCYHFYRKGYLDACSKRAEAIGNVRIVYRPPVETLIHYYNAADLFVSAAVSTYETFGRSPVEAMACGTPPILAKYNGFRETVTPETGFLVPTSGGRVGKRPDVPAFVKTILAALQDRQALKGKARSGIERARQFEVRTTLRELLKELGAPSPPPPAKPRATLSLGEYPHEIRSLWPSLEGTPLAKLVIELVATGELPARPSKIALQRFWQSWFVEF